MARKILILIRESGYEMEMEHIENNCFLTKECMETNNNEDFLLFIAQTEKESLEPYISIIRQ